ncbi:MAG: cytochrome c maturation protein CcmE [candidate division Zixibacteria bacterium]|nr:cytochrome c maturation protein CcmE [candidate division Zixibacteria bacterium]
MNGKYIAGILVVVVFLAWGTSAFLKTTIQYVSLEEARTASRTVQVMGKIDFATVNHNSEQSRLEFAIYDAEADDPIGADRLEVHYYGVVPGNFDQATSVVLKGKPQSSSFVAEQMLVKCPSKYQGDVGDEYQDIDRHMDTTESSGI